MELATAMITRAVAAPAARSRCDRCARTPLGGETVHVLADGAAVCELCLPAVSAESRAGARPERVPAGARRLNVGPRAA